jgi:dipeptidyl aminopeptidase/acylaminoacyl peptidase
VKAVVAVVAAGIVAMLSLAAAAPAAVPGQNGRIFFSARSGCGVASLRPNGTGYNCVDPSGRDPAVSPDNRRLTSVRGDQLVEVYGSAIDGKGVQRLTHAPGEFPISLSPSFSPDSRRILWFKYGGNSGEDGLYLMNADGSGQHQLTGDGGQDPVFSPTGAQIAYTLRGIAIAGGDGGGSHLILGDQNHATTSPLGHYLEQNGEPSWAPDGSRLAFSRRTRTDTIICDPAPPACGGSTTDTARDVFSINPDGSDVRQLTSTPAVDELDPSWSPDGRMIAYYRRPANRDDSFGEVWVMNADGSGKRRVGLGANPEWSSLQGGPGRPVLTFRFHRLNRHRRCLGRLDGWSARVKTSALRFTDFDISFYLDGRLVEQVSNTRDLGMGVDLTQARRGRTHRLRVLVVSPAVHDRLSRSFRFRRC